MNELLVYLKSHVLARRCIVPSGHDELARDGVLDVFVYLKHSKVSFILFVHMHPDVDETEDAEAY